MPSPTRNLSHRSAALQTIMLAGDAAGSVLATMAAGQRQLLAYAPYGVCHQRPGGASVLAFNGERPEPATGHYLLGNGYRAFNPALMRFNSPDSLSPFGRGGLNAYGYCAADPVNTQDPTGHFALFKTLRRLVSRFTRAKPKDNPVGTSYKPNTQTLQAELNVPSGQPAALRNRFESDLHAELYEVQGQIKSTGQDPRRIIHERGDLLSAAKAGPLKYVMNNLDEFSVATDRSIDHPMYVSHPALAGPLHSKRIVSAGTLHVDKINQNIIAVSNWSGHYQPTQQQLGPGIRKIKQMGFKVEVIRLGF
jgi:RHS repeat-associated protein